MKIDRFGQQIYTEHDLCEAIMRNPECNLDGALVLEQIDFNAELDIVAPKLEKWLKSDETIEEFDTRLQSEWRMPQEYKDLDIVTWLLEQCKTEEELQRVGEELLLYVDFKILPLLQYLKYLVDTMRVNKIVWGVGRGSSVASYCLYLIGVHKINSIYYDLDIKEFLK